MQKAPITQRIVSFFMCPHCGKTEHNIGHIIDGGYTFFPFGPWYCRECGGSFAGKIENGELFLEKRSETRRKTHVFLRHGDALLVLNATRYSSIREDAEADEYLYNEHTCPTNFMNDVEYVVGISDGDTDPHGIFEYVKTIPATTDEKQLEQEIANVCTELRANAEA